jgi:hypothetical protein
MIRWAEHIFVLSTRWLLMHYKVWFTGQQRCKVCGCRDKFNFNIDDSVWKKVVPEKYQKRVVCLSCFDDFAKRKGGDYSTSLKELYFVGNKVVLQFFCSNSSSEYLN